MVEMDAPVADATLSSLTREIGAESAVVVVRDGVTGERTVIASAGLPEVAVAGLTAAMRDPRHPVSATFDAPVAAFDVQPTGPGGPALRSHVPITRAGRPDEPPIAVLAIAHDRSLRESDRDAVTAAVSDLASMLGERTDETR